MKSKLNLHFKFTKKINKNVEKLIEEIVKSLKNKIDNKEKDRKIELKKSKVKDRLILNIKSTNTNITDFIIQLEKLSKEKLGKEHKIGMNFEVFDYEIMFNLEKEPKEKIKIPFADSLEIKNKNIKIKYKKLDEKFIKNHNVERTIKLIKEKIDKQYYEGKTEIHEIIYTSPKIKPAWNKDPTNEMLALKWIKQGPTKGKWFYGPQITSIFKAMEAIAIEEILKPIGFVETISSNIISAEDIWFKTGHLEGLPMEIYYVVEPSSRDPKVWEDFIDELKITKEIPYSKLDNLLKRKPLYGLSYAQCPVMYWAFNKKTLADKDIPLLIYDKTQVSFRYESGGRHGIERVDEFHRIEPVFIGSQEQVIKIKDKFLELYKKVFNKILEIEWRAAWVTPFYMQQAGKLHEFEKDKIKGTIDFEAWMPYRGPREKSEWLEFQNLSILGDKYTKAFNIRAQTKELWSGCSGIGIERWAAVFLAQKGLDPKNWPKGFRKYLSKLPKEIKFY